MMTSALSMFSKNFYYYAMVALLTIFNIIQYKNAIVGADNPKNLIFDVTTCSLEEPYYNYTFNLLNLKSELGRDVVLSSGRIKFNFCSAFDFQCGDKQNVHACLVKNDKKYVLATSQKVTYNNGRISFKFDGGENCQDGKNYQLIVDLGCDYTMDSVLYGIDNSNDPCLYHIKYEDSRACLQISKDVKFDDCKVTDKDYTFDLSPLGEFNYRVSDRNNSEFILNPCQPVSYDFNATCPSGSSVCYYTGSDELNKRFVNYGTKKTNPIMEDNNPVIIYETDTKCNSTHNFKSKIYFFCDWANEYGNPEFNHFADCTYHFVWRTLTACRKNEKEEDIPCYLRDPTNQFVFNMSSLTNKYYEDVFNGKKYSFAICKIDDENNGAYLLNGDKKESRGRISSILLRNKIGIPYLAYDSDVRCSDSMKWKTEIYFICPESRDSEYKIKVKNDTDCILRINFETKLACPYDVSCKIPDYSIDLTSLINSTGYYIAKVNDSLKDVVKSKQFIVNVCRPIKQTKMDQCYDGSGACIASLGDDNKIKTEQSLGHPTVSLTKTGDSKAELKYFNGSPCQDGKNENLSSSIQFYCDHKAGKGLPILQSIIEKCYYKFDWPTNVICPGHSVKFGVDTCEINNDVTNVKFNLKDAKFTGGNGKITVKNGKDGVDETIDLCSHNNVTASVDYSHSVVTMFFNSNKKCAGQDSSEILIQLNLVCGAILNRTVLYVVFKYTAANCCCK